MEAKVNLGAVATFRQAVAGAESDVVALMNEISAAIDRNLQTLRTDHNSLMQTQTECNQALARMESICARAKQQLKRLEGELLSTPRKTKKTKRDENGEPVTVMKDNPRYLQLQNEIHSVKRDIMGYENLIKNLKALSQECSQQQRKVHETIQCFSSEQENLKSIIDTCQSKFTRASETLTSIYKLVQEYVSVSISGGYASVGGGSFGGNGYTQSQPSGVFWDGKKESEDGASGAGTLIDGEFDGADAEDEKPKDEKKKTERQKCIPVLKKAATKVVKAVRNTSLLRDFSLVMLGLVGQMQGKITLDYEIPGKYAEFVEHLESTEGTLLALRIVEGGYEVTMSEGEKKILPPEEDFWQVIAPWLKELNDQLQEKLDKLDKIRQREEDFEAMRRANLWLLSQTKLKKMKVRPGNK